MTKSALFCLFYIFSFTPAYSQFQSDYGAKDNWLKQPTPVSARLYDCHFIDSLEGWASGDSGVIIHTTNGGQNWEIQDTPIDFFIEDLFILDENRGWAVANDFFFAGTTILSTTNGGQNWTSERFDDTTVVLLTINFLDSLNGWLGGFAGKIFKTTDGGQNWTPSLSDSSFASSFPITKMAFFSDDYGYACGGQIDIAGVMWRTTNSGLLWNAGNIAFEPIFDVLILDSLNVIGVGGDFEYGTFVVRTTDAGENWDYNQLNIFGQGQAISFRTPAEAWIPLSFSETWAYTLDSGNTWTEIPVNDSLPLFDVTFVSPSHGWAVGDSGLVLRYNPNAVNITGTGTQIPQKSTLFQNYPNPFNPETTINFFLHKPSVTEIIVYDMLGREVKSYFLGRTPSGNHSVKFNSAGFPSGTYYYTLKTEGYIETKKMLLIK